MITEARGTNEFCNRKICCYKICIRFETESRMQILQAVKNFPIALQRPFYSKVVEKQKKKSKLFATVFASWVFQCELKRFIYNYFSVAKRLQNVKKKLQRPYEF